MHIRANGGVIMNTPEVETVDVWAASITDKPGGLALALLALYEAGANLEFVIARRAPESPGKGVVFVAPLRGEKQIAAAAKAGFNVTQTLHCVRIVGDDVPGAAAKLTEAIAEAKVNLRGFSAAALAGRFVAYFGVDSPEEARKVAQICGQR
jgi:hypothetical protein